MSEITLPDYELKIRESGSVQEVFDPVRRHWVSLTPEERVRQLFLKYLIEKKGYPAGLIAIEQHFRFANGKPQRTDIVVHDKKGQPFLLVECKAPSVKITQDIFRQVSRYNAVIGAKYIAVTNGSEHYCFSTEDLVNYTQIALLPKF